MPTDKEILNRYLPEASIPLVLEWLKKYNVQLKISKSRNTKHGDYRPPIRQAYHRISVNHDLNRYHFLLTFVHELAHLVVWEKHKNKVKPHGTEWKKQFRELMNPVLTVDFFPEDLLNVLQQYLKNPAASSSDIKLATALAKYNSNKTPVLTVADIPVNGFFRTQNGMVFKKGEKMRTRYRCVRVDNKRLYMVSAVAEVLPVNK